MFILGSRLPKQFKRNGAREGAWWAESTKMLGTVVWGHAATSRILHRYWYVFFLEHSASSDAYNEDLFQTHRILIFLQRDVIRIVCLLSVDRQGAFMVLHTGKFAKFSKPKLLNEHQRFEEGCIWNFQGSTSPTWRNPNSLPSGGPQARCSHELM